KAPQHGPASGRLAERRRTDRLQMGDQPQGATDRLQARLDETRQGGPIQAQRRHARTPADRRYALSGHGNPGQPRRQGEAARYLGLEVLRRVSAVVLASTTTKVELHTATPPRFGHNRCSVAPPPSWKARPQHLL